MNTPLPRRRASMLGRHRVPLALRLLVTTAVTLAFLGTMTVWSGGGPVQAQTEEAGVSTETEQRTTGTVAFDPETETAMVKGDDESIEVSVSGLLSGEEGSYAVKITSNSKFSESSSCGGTVSETFYPSSSTTLWDFDVYACSTGRGTLTATLTYYYSEPVKGDEQDDTSNQGRQSTTVDTDSVTIAISAPSPRGSVTATGPSSLTVWDDQSYSVTASGLNPGEEGSYYVEVSSTSHLSESSSCSSSVSEIFYASSSTKSWDFDVYGCSVGSGTLTAKLYYVQFDPVDGGGRDDEDDTSNEPRQASLIHTDTEGVKVEHVEVEIDADDNLIDEGEDAEFTITANVNVRSALTVSFSVTEQGDFLDGTPPSSATISSGSDSVTLDIETYDDDTYESNGRITVTLLNRTAYDLGTTISDFAIVVSEDPLPPPAAPTISRFISSTTGAPKLVTISWGSVTGADDYLVENRVGSGSWKSATKYLTPTQPFSRHASGDQFIVDCGGTNDFHVSAFGDGTNRAAEWGDPSSTRSVSGPRCLAPAPDRFDGSATSPYAIRLTWDRVSNAHTYRIEQQKHGETSWTSVDYVSPPATSLIVDDLTCETRYYYRIGARGDGTSYETGYGSTSESGGIDTQDCPVATIATAADKVDEGTMATFTVTLNPSVPINVAVNIEVTESGSYLSTPTPTVVRVNAGNTTGTLELSVRNDNAYVIGGGTITVALLDGDTYNLGANDQAVVAVRPLPKAPENLGVTDATQDGVTKARLSWDAVTGANRYLVERRLDGTGAWAEVSKILIAPGDEERTLTPGGEYPYKCVVLNEYVVSAFGDHRLNHAAAYGPRTAPVSFYPPDCKAPPPENFDGLASSPYEIGLTWDRVSNAETYRIEQRKQGETSWTTVEDVSPPATSLTVDNLTCGTTYYFQISAKGDGDLYVTGFGDARESGGIPIQDCPIAIIATGDPKVDEGMTATFTVTLDKLVPINLEVTIAVTETDSYLATPTPTIVEITAGSTSADLELSIHDDNAYVIGGGTITVTLADGETYDLDTTNTSSQSATVMVRPLPKAPENLGVTDATEDGVTKARLSWDAVTGANRYLVERRLDGTGAWAEVSKILIAPGDEERTLTPGGEYPYKCVVLNEYVVSAFGDHRLNHAAAYGPRTAPVSFYPPDCKAPPPENFDGLASSPYEIGLTWDRVSNAETYRIEQRKQGETSWTTVEDVSPPATSLTVDNLTCGTTYYFQISAKGDGAPYVTGFGDARESGGIPIQDCPIAIIATGDPKVDEGMTATFTVTLDKSVPINLEVTIAVTETDSYLATPTPTIVEITAGSTSADLELSIQDDNDYVTDGTITVTLADGETYDLDMTNTSSQSATVMVRPLPKAPENLGVTDATEDGVTKARLSWDAVTGANRYLVERRTASSTMWVEVSKITSFDPADTTRTLTPGGDYPFECGEANEFTVSTFGDHRLDHAAAYGPRSNIVSAPICSVQAPTNLSATALTEYTVSLSWTAPGGASIYKIEKSIDPAIGWELADSTTDAISAPATSHVVTDLVCNTEYSFRISAKGDASNYGGTFGPTSTPPLVVRTNPCPILSITSVATPIFEGFAATFSISMTMLDMSGNPIPHTVSEELEVALTVELSQAPEGSFFTGVIPANIPFLSNTSDVELSLDTDDDSVGEPSGGITVTLGESPYYVLDGNASSATITVHDNDLPIPDPPDDLSISPLTNYPTFFRAEWTRADNIADYNVEFRLENAKDWESFGSYGIRSTIGVSKSLLCGNDYEFQIRAFGDGETTRAVHSAYSTMVDYTTPDCLSLDAPQDLEAANEGLTSIDLSWSPVTGAITYKVEYMAETVEEWTALENEVLAPGVGPFDASPNGTVAPTVTVPDLVCRTNYSFRVSARGNGRLYPADFGDPSGILLASTERSYALCADRVPSFNSETIGALAFDVGIPVDDFELPMATGGDHPLTYSIEGSSPLPNGLVFDTVQRTLSGTPTLTSCAKDFLYKVIDSDATAQDSATLDFTITIADSNTQALTLNGAVISDWTYSTLTNSTALQLPRATGGFGPLRYTITPALPAGMTFDLDRLLIYGIPSSTLSRTEYKYTVNSRFGCATTDSQSISFHITVPGPPAFPYPRISPTGLTATADNTSGTISLSWNADANIGYGIQQWRLPGYSVSVPSATLTLTCGGKVATVCPQGSTSAVIAGLPSGSYYYKLAPHNGRDFNDSSSGLSNVMTLSPASDPSPTFGMATVADLVFIEDRPIDPVTLPIAVGGNGRLEYSLTPDLPDGLSFNPITRTISGTPDDDLSPEIYTYTVIDSDATNPDTNTIRFKIEVADTEITITGLPSRMSKGDETEFTVEVTDTPELGAVKIVVEAFGGANDTSSTTESDIGFNSDCSDIEEMDLVAADVSSHTATFTLHACDAQYNGGGIVKAYLTNNGAQISDTVEVDVVVAPKVTASDISSPVYEGQAIAFTVDVDGLKSTVEYDVKANAYAGENGVQSTTNSDLGFNATTCSEVTKSVDVPSGSTSHSASFTVHVCDSEYDGGIVMITLVDASDNIIAGDWLYLEARPITVRIEADNPFPITDGTVAEREVELTAVMDAPKDATFGYYEWTTEEPDADPCANDSSDNTSTYEESSTTSTTKTVWAIIKEDSDDTECYVADPIYITWDQEETLQQITDALVAVMIPVADSTTDSMTSPPTPTPFPVVEQKLLDCVAKPPPAGTGVTYDSFAHLLNHYSGDLKTLLDSGACSTQAATAWNNLTAGFEDAVESLKTDASNNLTPVGELLATPDGETLEENLTSISSIKEWISGFVVPAAAQFVRENSRLESESDSDNQANGPRQGEDDGSGSWGLECFPAANQPDIAQDAPVSKRLKLLNCLIYVTPWSFWTTLAEQRAQYQADPELSTSQNTEISRYVAKIRSIKWLREEGDLVCSGGGEIVANEHESAACLKHDLAWGGLPRFAGSPTNERNEDDPDSAWNPRNKALSDRILLLDLTCANRPLERRAKCLSEPSGLVEAALSSFYFSSKARVLWRIVADFRDADWPITTAEVNDGIRRPFYMECSNPITQAHDFNIEKIGNSRGRLSWTITPGCGNAVVEEVKVHSRNTLEVRTTSGNSIEFPIDSNDEIFEDVFIVQLFMANKLYGPAEYEQEVEVIHAW